MTGGGPNPIRTSSTGANRDRAAQTESAPRSGDGYSDSSDSEIWKDVATARSNQAARTPSEPTPVRPLNPPPKLPPNPPLSRRTFLGWLGLLAASLGLSGGALAQGDENVARPGGAAGGGTLGLGIVGLHVTDLGASLDFYRRLGLAVPTDVDLSGGAFRLPLPTGQIFFWETLAYTRADFPDYEPGTGQRRVSLEFGFRTAGEVDAVYAALTAEGYGSYAEPLSWGPVRYAGVVDPDGNQIALRFPLVS